MKVKIGTIQITPDQQVAMFTDVLDRYLEAEIELASARGYLATKSQSAKVPEIRARRDEKRETLIAAYRDALGAEQ